MTETIPFLLTGVIVLYAMHILYFLHGWLKIYKPRHLSDSPAISVTVVVAVRNEAENIGALLTCLSMQNYPCHLFEVIISDDFSEDHTRQIVNDFASRNANIRLISAQTNQPQGKKPALSRAIENATGELILTTDGDCTMGEQWISTLVQHYVASGARFLIGPVNIAREMAGWFSQLQTLEFMSITGVTGGAAGIGDPVMCNGANLAFRRDDWQQLHPATGGQSYFSGDDVFLMHAFKKRFPGSIRFVNDARALVTTLPTRTIREFFCQRSRWAEKSAGFTDPFTLITGSITALTNISLVVSLIISIFSPGLILYTIMVWGIKMIVDILLLWQVAGFIQQRKLLWYFPFLSVVYPFYVTATLILAIFTPGRWKNRPLKNQKNTKVDGTI